MRERGTTVAPNVLISGSELVAPRHSQTPAKAQSQEAKPTPNLATQRRARPGYSLGDGQRMRRMRTDSIVSGRPTPSEAARSSAKPPSAFAARDAFWKSLTES